MGPIRPGKLCRPELRPKKLSPRGNPAKTPFGKNGKSICCIENQADATPILVSKKMSHLRQKFCTWVSRSSVRPEFEKNQFWLPWVSIGFHRLPWASEIGPEPEGCRRLRKV